MLRNIVFAIVPPTLVEMAKLKGINKPDGWHHEGTKEEHNSFFLDHSKIVFVIIMIF
jgi:hypothetical protein